MKTLNAIVSLLIVLTIAGCSKENSKPPNIVIIYADDMGYGDLNCQNEKSKILTPNLDKLASEGMRFSDAHSSSGICSPSRFALLTGTYHWRRQHDIVGVFGKPFFRESDITLPQVLKTKGYTTACIGKWHLGWDWEFLNEPSGEVMQWGSMRKVYLPEDIDWSKPIAGGPLERGFDYYFGDGTINFPPYAWVENDRFIELPSEEMNINSIGYETKEGEWEFNPGPKVAGWNPYKVLPTLTEKALKWIDKQDNSQPFFLYFALPSPHAPIIPNDEFDGKSKAGAYGDFVFQSDWVVGQVLDALIENGLEDNTIVVFSSDNGPEAYAWKRAAYFEHFSMGDFRGLKRDVWEGGHHVPFIIKWPGEIEAGSVSDEVISQVDLMATLTKITGIELPDHAAPDSYNILPILKGEEHSSPFREATVHNTFQDTWGIRKGDWLYIDGPSGGHREPPESFKRLKGYTDFSTEGILFNLKEDPEQLVNLYEKYPERIQEMDMLLQKYRESGYSIKKETSPLRIMTYNIWNGFDWGKDTVRKENTIEWIKSQKPDVLALQELCSYTEKELKEDALKWGHQYVQLLKTEGYPTALTSNRPINLKERIVLPFWHGLLHCETYSIDFYIVHLSPADCDFRLDEARLITERIKKNKSNPYIILGDFNSLSPFDAVWMEKNTDLKNRSLQNKNTEYSNLRLGEYDYSVISEFLACPAVDVSLGKIELQEAYTFPTPALIGKFNQTSQTIVQNRERIDYILASPALAKTCKNVEVFNQEETHLLSDHYPMMAEFDIFLKSDNP